MYNKKFRWNSLLQKTAELDHTVKRGIVSLERPNPGRESCKQDPFLCAEMAGDVSVNFI